MVSKELQYGYSRAQALLSVKSFSSCFLGYRAQVLLLRLFSFTAVGHCTAQAVSRFVCKKVRPVFRYGLFCIPLCARKPACQAEKYDLARFWWSILLFFRKGQF